MPENLLPALILLSNISALFFLVNKQRVPSALISLTFYRPDYKKNLKNQFSLKKYYNPSQNLCKTVFLV
ncbi:MAG: hypothetical protein KAV87_32785 [Desulfobacteraceae bacterium]|nr:hypothetical protein [Desulfobacteraceae bacterium]